MALTPKQVLHPQAKGKDKLTNKQRKIVKAVGSGKTQREAAKIAEVSETYVSEVLKKPEVIESLQNMMAKHGLDDESILKAHAEMIKATRGEEPDWAARGKGIEMAYKLKGAFTEKTELTGLNGGPIVEEVRVTFVNAAKND